MKTGIDCIGISTSFFCHDGEGKFLMHKRSKTCRDEQDAWDCGGGKLEFGLTLKQNVLKEVQEEYGCIGIIEEQLPATTILRVSPEGIQTHWIAVPFILLIDSTNIKKVKIGDPDKMAEMGWFTFSNLPQPVHSGFQKIAQLYKNIFEKYS